MNFKRFAFALLFICFASVSIAQPKQKPVTTDYLVVIETSFGKIFVVLFDDTPIHKANFLKLAQSGFYNGTRFHRIIPGFMIQAGEDTTSFSKNKSFEEITLPAEILEHHKHVYGAFCAARNNNPEKRSDRTQFYIVQNPEGAHFLDGQYTVFGQVVAGLDVVHKIAQQERNLNDMPLYDIRITVTTLKVTKEELKKYYNYQQ